MMRFATRSAIASRGETLMFERIVGQERAIEFLRRAVITGRIGHAYAFVGPSGVGRKLTALALGQWLLCPAHSPLTRTLSPEGRGHGEGACGQCPACKKVERLVHPDLHLITPDGQNIKIEQVRELEREASLHPVEGRWKVFIIDEAERMTLPTANAFLKTLEEPPDHTLLILILSQVQALPATILSRCQVVRFVPLAERQAVDLLLSRGFPEVKAHRAARLFQGRVGLALTGDKEEWAEQAQQAFRILEEVRAKGADVLFQHAESLGRDRAKVESLIVNYWLWYRDLLTMKAGGDSELIIHDDRLGELEREAQALSWEAIFDGLAACRAAWQALAGNAAPRLTLEVTLSRLAFRAA